MSPWQFQLTPMKRKLAYVGVVAGCCTLIGLGASILTVSATKVLACPEFSGPPMAYAANIPTRYDADMDDAVYRDYIAASKPVSEEVVAKQDKPATPVAPTTPAAPATTTTPSKPQTKYVTSAKWYVTTDEYSDRVGNLCSIYNFCRLEWANARQWCIDNYNAKWPYGPVKQKYEATNFGVAVSMATAACCIRESSTVPDNMQNMGVPGTFKGSIGSSRSLEAAFEILEHPANLQGYGIIQFTASNLTHFVTFCKASNLDPRLLETQLKFMAYQYYSNAYMHRQYSYLEDYNSLTPTLTTVSELAQLHTSVIGMGNKPSAYYAKPTISVKNILRDWGTARYQDFTRAASGAYELLYSYATTGVIPR